MRTLFSLLSVALFIACLISPLQAEDGKSNDDTNAYSPKSAEWQMKGYARALFDRDHGVVVSSLVALRFQRPEYRNRYITAEVAQRLVKLLGMEAYQSDGEWIVTILTEMGRRGKPYLPVLVAMLQNPNADSDARSRVGINLSKIDAERSLLPSFRATLLNKSASNESRCAAAYAMQYMGGLKPEDAPILFSLVKGKPSNLTQPVLSFIGSLGKSALPPLAELLTLLNTRTEREVRYTIAELIAKRDDTASIAALLNVINNSKANLIVRAQVVLALEETKNHEMFAPTLSALLQNRKTPTALRKAVVSLYEEWRDESKLPLLVEILRDAMPTPTNDDERNFSALGKSAAPYIPEMMDYARLRPQFIRYNLLASMSKIEGGTTQFSSLLADIARDANAEQGLRWDAIIFLLDTERSNTPVLPEIIHWLKTRNRVESEAEDATSRTSIAREVASAGDALKPFLPDLTDLIMDKETDSSITSSLTVTLRNLGYSLDSVLSEFTKIANDPKQPVMLRGKATSIIGNIRPLTLEESLVHLNLTYGKLQEPLKRRFEVYAYSGGDPAGCVC